MADFVHADDREAVRRASEAAIASDQRYDIEHRIIRGDGAVRWVHTKADVVRNDAGKPLRMVGTIQDITDRRLLEEQLRQAQKLEAIGRLAGGIAHDLNNALTAIVGYTELSLGTLADGHPARPDVQEIRRAAERAESVTRQLLAFSRKQLLEPRVFYVNDSVANLGRMLERLLGSGIEMKTAIAEGLPPIYGDPGQIEQAIINLAVNARDAMPDGGRLTLGVTLVDVTEAFAQAHQPMTPGLYVELSVVDTGEGMDPATQAHIFEPFFTTKEVGKGTGLGLAMVYGTVKQSGGYIFVESAPGQGTVFHLYFPPVRAAQPARTTQPAPVARDAEVQPTVLVVEDDPAVRTLVVSALRGEGYRVMHAGSGKEALQAADNVTGPIDLLLTDANMPGMTGIEVAGALLAARPALKIVMMSGYTAEPLTVGGSNQAVALLPKPFTPRDLRQKIRDVLGR
jgi:signal transduction histidine kinase